VAHIFDASDSMCLAFTADSARHYRQRAACACHSSRRSFLRQKRAFLTADPEVRRTDLVFWHSQLAHSLLDSGGSVKLCNFSWSSESRTTLVRARFVQNGVTSLIKPIVILLLFREQQLLGPRQQHQVSGVLSSSLGLIHGLT
jgi:hypothetical protein